MTELLAEVTAALDLVVDPCSDAVGVPLGLAAMGLVASVVVEVGRVDVRLRLTSACCAYGPGLAAAAEAELARVIGVADATVTVDYGAPWSPADMAPPATAVVAGRRRRTLALTGVTPYDWTNWTP